MNKSFSLIFIGFALFLPSTNGLKHIFKIPDLNATFEAEYRNDIGFDFKIIRNGIDIYRGNSADLIGHEVALKIYENGISFQSKTKQVVILIKEMTKYFVEFQIIHHLNPSESITDCSFILNKTFWYGGLEQSDQQYFPINKQKYDNLPYVTKDGNAVAERYWLNSRGLYLVVEPQVPLFFTMKPGEQFCFVANRAAPYTTGKQQDFLSYRIGIATDSRKAHLNAVQRHLKRPSTEPDYLMSKLPIWSTWAKFKTNINESVVYNFAMEIVKKGFNGCQIEIDDKWETCYGSLTIDRQKFPNMPQLVQKLKELGFRVTVWIHPFINNDCFPWYTEGKVSNYFVTNSTGNIETQWWNSGAYQSAVLDFTNVEAKNWFISRLRQLQLENGFDGYKFDAGETSWSPPMPIQNDSPMVDFQVLTTDYIKTVAGFGGISEVRAGFRNQKEGIYMRMLDRQSEFSLEGNGLASVVTTLLQLNMVGYPFVLPDMVGGNGYNGSPDDELFIRWLQANVFMPSIQFSYVPWDYAANIVESSKKFVKLHIKYFSLIKKAMRKAVQDGTPVNQPIWWLDPSDEVALGVGDEFLLGERILVAPILQRFVRSRDIYLPRGTWIDGNNRGITIKGPMWFRNYYAPLDVLPFFILKKK